MSFLFSSYRSLAGAIAILLAITVPTMIPSVAAEAAAGTISGPSFDCAKPSEIEAVICGDAELSAADRRMAALYDIAKPGVLGTGSNQLAAQRNWLRERDKTCARENIKAFYKGVRNCIVAEYDDRLGQLAIATLIANTKASMSELQRINPKGAPLYQAAYDYVSINDHKRRIDIVEADLAPIYATMDANTRRNLSAPFHDLDTGHNAAASDENFAAFFAIYATFELDNGTWPCAVLVKRPGLIAGLGFQFGGAIDGRIPSSDCAAALPPLREVTALSDAASAVQPFCQGTIRFSTWREYAKLQDAVQLHRTEYWEGKGRPASLGADIDDTTEPAWRREHRSEIGKAEAVLEDYYVRTFAAGRQAAKRDARSAINMLVDGPFQFCG